MLAVAGLLIILIFLLLIMSKKMSVLAALVLVPVVVGLLFGINPKALGEMSLAGIKQVAPAGIMLMFAVLYFAIMLDAGLFDPLISRIISMVQGDPLKVILGTALLTMIVHLDGDGTATFMIVVTAFLPVYKKLGIQRMILPTIVALSVGPLHLVPWSGTSARAISTLKTDAAHIFLPNLPAIAAGMAWVICVAWILGSRERKRLGKLTIQHNHRQSLTEEQLQLRRPKLFLVNALLTIALITALMSGLVPAPALFILASALAIALNYPKPADQQKILRLHGTNIFLVSSMIFAAGIFSGILTGGGMVDAMAKSLVDLIPAEQMSLLPMLTALTSMPASLFFTPDAYYFGVVPVLAEAASQSGINPLEIGRAALLGQMTVGFPVSPLTASTFLLVGLCEVDLGEHQRNTFLWAMGTTLVMTITALLTGSIHV